MGLGARGNLFCFLHTSLALANTPWQWPLYWECGVLQDWIWGLTAPCHGGLKTLEGLFLLLEGVVVNLEGFIFSREGPSLLDLACIWGDQVQRESSIFVSVIGTCLSLFWLL